MDRKRRSNQPFLPGLDLTPVPSASPVRYAVSEKVPPKTQRAPPEVAPRNAPHDCEPTVVVAADIRHADRPSGERRALGVFATRLAEIAVDLHLADQLSAERPAAATPPGGDRDHR